MMRKKLPIGIENFKEFFSEDFYYIDKTLFIKELLERWGEVNVFTRPRCFGKSLNMSMLKFFFEIGGNPSLFDGLKIMQEKHLCEKYMGKFPVISIRLGSVDGRDFQTALAALRRVIGMEALRFDFLSESGHLGQGDRALYNRLAAVKDGSFTMSNAFLSDSLRILSQLLEKHYGQRVIILIDEYDMPFDNALRAGYYEEMAHFICSLFGNALKTNDSLYFAVLTGCFGMPGGNIATGLNNLNVHTVSDVWCDEFFGFTDADVDEILKFYGLSSYKSVIRDWYGGYRFGGTDLYSPAGVFNYCDVLLANPCAEPENYWANISGNGRIRRLLKSADMTTRSEIEELLNGGQITKRIKPGLACCEADDGIENVWSALYAAGYLTGMRVKGEDAFRLWIPNEEIRELFCELVKDWFRELIRSDPSRISRFCAAFPAGDTDTIQEMLSVCLWESIRMRDTAVRGNRKESFYQKMLLELLRNQDSWLVKSNAETAEGCSDISIQTSARSGILIGLKYAEDGNLEKACAEALSQMEEKEDAEGPERQSAKKIIRYGIAFYKKRCMVALGE